MKRLLASLVLVGLVGHPLSAQDLLARWLSPRPVLTTSIASAVRDQPLLDPIDDDDVDVGLADLRTQPRDANGVFTVAPGGWELTVQSFCLLAGTTGPTGGNGYLYAPLAGPGASTINGILDRSFRAPDIPQETIQSLLWAILAHARFSQLPADLQQAGRRLMTAGEIAALEASAMDRVTDAVREQVAARLPPAAAAVFNAEARLRDAFDAGRSYAEQADIAVRDGAPEPQRGDRDIPAGRWSLIDNLFVRFLPSHYTTTRIQVAKPETVTIDTDARGRIVALRSPDGWSVETTYDDRVAPLVVPGDPGLKGYAFKTIVLRQPVNGRVESLSVEDAGWTFQGHSTGKGRVPEQPLSSSAATTAVDVTGIAGGPSAWQNPEDRYNDWGKRYRDYKRSVDHTAPLSDHDVDRVTDLKHYAKGVKDAVSADPTGKAKWLQDHFNRLGRAAMYVLCRLEGGCDPDAPSKYQPRGAAVPGQQGAQRLGLSGR